MFTCKNPTKPVHQHTFVTEAKQCWGLTPGIVAPAPPVVLTKPVRMATPRQIAYVGDLGGSKTDAAAMTMEDCSAYIDLLKSQPKEKPVSEVANYPNPKLGMVEGLLPSIPEGYYAVQADSGEDIIFLRLSRPKHTARRSNRYAGSTKIQTQHGPRLQIDAVWWPSGNWSFYNYSQSFMVDQLMLLIADHFTAAMRYAHKLNKCCRCNAELTDARSRHYGIGPECETKNGWGWVLDRVDALHDGRTFAQLLHAGLIDL